MPPSGPPHLKIQIHSHCRQQDAGTNEEMFPLVPLVARRRLQVQTSKKCLIRRATLSSRLRSCGQCLSGVTVTGDPDEVKSEDQRQRCHLLSHPDCPPAPSSTVALRSSLPVVRVCSAASMSTPAASVVPPSPSPTRRLTVAVASPSASSQPAQRRRQAKRARTFVRARVE